MELCLFIYKMSINFCNRSKTPTMESCETFLHQDLAATEKNVPVQLLPTTRSSRKAITLSRPRFLNFRLAPRCLPRGNGRMTRRKRRGRARLPQHLICRKKSQIRQSHRASMYLIGKSRQGWNSRTLNPWCTTFLCPSFLSCVVFGNILAVLKYLDGYPSK